jgi:restriction system protein
MIRLATTPLVKAGWMVKNEKGRWYITEEGRQACRNFSNVQDLYTEALRLSEMGKQSTPEILMSLEIVQERAWQLIETYLQERKPMEIRMLLADLLVALHYHITWIAPIEKKHGQIDMVISTDALGSKPYRILAQVKHKGQPITMEGFRSFVSVLGANDFGLLFSTGGFTRDVVDEINSGAYARVNAMDLVKFFDLWIKNYAGLSQDAKLRLPLKEIYFLSPPDSI